MQKKNSLPVREPRPLHPLRSPLVALCLLAGSVPLGLGCSSPGSSGNNGAGIGAFGNFDAGFGSGGSPGSAGSPSAAGSPTTTGAPDPGPRRGPPGAGGPVDGLTTDERNLFEAALDVFKEIDSVAGAVVGEDGKGLGPTFNSNGCASCHAQPEVGGTSPGTNSPQTAVARANPQVEAATLDHATNVIPSFVLADGPVREARFKSDGGVHGLFTIAGRTDAPGCNEAQPDFETELANGNVVFRIPTPVFGLGLVENTPDSVLEANLQADASTKQALGIQGTFNTSGNDGTITRFGWKAQNKSLFIFAGEAYNVEQGVSNEMFGNERGSAPGCTFNPGPEDGTHAEPGLVGASAADLSGDIVSFALFMRLAAPPLPAAMTDLTRTGSDLFNNIGCGACHSPTLRTGTSRYGAGAMSNLEYHPYSDFALHHMGGGLADGISQGGAGPDQFRTAPLWGVGQRLFFLHDGRASDLVTAIQAHDSAGSEAHAVIQKFNALSLTDQADVLAFLRAL